MSIISLVLNDPFTNILVRFVFNISVLFILIRLIYYKFTRKEEYLFSFFLMGIIIFFICSILETLEVQLGMALGLFAIFSILRFRTVTFSVKDMTYIFIVIGISVINSQANIAPSVIGAVAINSIILVATYSLEIFYKKNVQNSLILVYNKPELLVPSQKKELLNDLSILTGQDIIKVVIHKINTSTGSSEVEVFFRDTAIK